MRIKVDVKPLPKDHVADAERVFASNPDSSGCFCMWFIIPVAQYHAGSQAANHQRFLELVQESASPIGLIAYIAGEPVGWCAAGPRSRFTRALKVPSFKGRNPSEDDSTWLVPCFNVLQDYRRQGVSEALLSGAVELARAQGATAIEGFPFAKGAKLGRESMVGLEAAFEACGFAASRRPSATRVVMRRQMER
jgi:GNAT superfamily N-acetyltransferase